MADFEAPSFSLGLDLDLDSEPQIPAREPSSCEPAPRPSTSGRLREHEDDEDSQHQIMDSDVDLAENAVPVLRRLRRGPNNGPASARKRQSMELCCNVDDEIEEFSSQEDLRGDDRSSTQYHSVCSSSKFPLCGHGVLTASHSKDRKRKEASNAPASASLEMSSDKLMFPKLTVSPLRRFQLLDSDSDDSSVGEDVTRDANEIDPPLKDSASEQDRKKASVSTPQTKDLWEDFCPMKSFNFPTPALDEVCEEYFRNTKNKDAAQKLETNVCMNKNKGSRQTRNIGENVECQLDSGDSLPPAHRYFFHEDPRIQLLVRSRLPNFFPLGVVNNGGNRQPDASVIDYMSQFSHGKGSKQQATGEVNNGRSSTKGKKKSKYSSAAEVSNASGSWVNPKCSASTPKNAGKRRVRADGQSSGHWYTGPDGRRVYVTRSGQELTGQTAYRHYRKESGGGFRKSKKKTPAKKK